MVRIESSMTLVRQTWRKLIKSSCAYQLGGKVKLLKGNQTMEKILLEGSLPE